MVTSGEHQAWLGAWVPLYAENNPPDGNVRPLTQASRTPAHGLRNRGLLLQETACPSHMTRKYGTGQAGPHLVPFREVPQHSVPLLLSVSRALLLIGKGGEDHQVLEGSF